MPPEAASYHPLGEIFRLVQFGMVLIALAVSGWSSGASALDVSELCGGFALFDNPETRVYRGKFEDNKGVTLDHVLVVAQTTDAGKALVFYIHGKQRKWNIKKSGCLPNIGQIDDDTLTLPRRNGKITYVFDDDGTASVKYVSRGHESVRSRCGDSGGFND